jgi:eukaryotic-like serine/threonine-protein kinase
VTARIHSPEDVVANRYSITDYLNEGGMQEVYIAEDRRLSRRVALKVPKNESATKRFERSAIVSAKVRHPNVAATLDFFEQNDRQYLIEELVPGSDLKNRLDTEFLYLDPHLAAHVFHHLARALAAAHHAGVCHRDLKPSNIIVSSDPGLSVVKITDFGVAKMADAEQVKALENESTISGSKTLVGHIPYMAPERFTAAQQVDLKSDVWALGALLYQLLSGDPPFGRGPAAIAKILTPVRVEKPRLFGKFASFAQLEAGLWEIISLCLTRDVSKRPSADDLVKKSDELCYALSPRYIGTVGSYAAGSGDWGFIKTDDEDVFLHRSQFYGTDLKVGMRVNFAQHIGRPRARAAPIIPLRS